MSARLQDETTKDEHVDNVLSMQQSHQAGDLIHISGPDPVLAARMGLLQDVGWFELHECSTA